MTNKKPKPLKDNKHQKILPLEFFTSEMWQLIEKYSSVERTIKNGLLLGCLETNAEEARMYPQP